MIYMTFLIITYTSSRGKQAGYMKQSANSGQGTLPKLYLDIINCNDFEYYKLWETGGDTHQFHEDVIVVSYISMVKCGIEQNNTKGHMLTIT